MYFEGSEKKIEMIATGARLRARPDAFWVTLCDLAGAKILSRLESGECTAFLLSESSLFVWDDRLLMLTCGQTTLVRAAAFLLDKIGLDEIEFFGYERKNEFFPHRQETDFYADAAALSAKVAGRALRFGFADEHHLLLYHLDRPYQASAADQTLELLFYDVGGPAGRAFRAATDLAAIREHACLAAVFANFQIDDHLFEPHGYSLNGLNGAQYFTLHVTPEESGAYLSFATNVAFGERTDQVVQQIVTAFRPRSYDVICFSAQNQWPFTAARSFNRRSLVTQALSCGLTVTHAAYVQPELSARPAELIEVAP